MIIRKVKFAEKAPYPRTVAKKACVREGLEFEAKVQSTLTREVRGVEHYASRWISYEEDGRLRHAQPDHFFRTPEGKLIIVEVKLRHTPRSAEQLLKYGTLLRELFPEDEICLVEVFKYWDWVHYPAENERVNSGDILSVRPEVISIIHMGESLC